ncbi:MAG: DUF2200 domain-containing protein [Saprospiraceae bacterium]|nr:DUF2200 domain-containing protein [Saprospiraceae bacterium]
MKESEKQNERIAHMTFASVYPYYIIKVEKKGRSKVELDKIISWLTSYSESQIAELVKEKVTLERFFENAKLQRNAKLITGLICGYRVEDIENELTRNVRYLDKIVDELAKGRKIESIMRT